MFISELLEAYYTLSCVLADFSYCQFLLLLKDSFTNVQNDILLKNHQTILPDNTLFPLLQ